MSLCYVVVQTSREGRQDHFLCFASLICSSVHTGREIFLACMSKKYRAFKSNDLQCSRQRLGRKQRKCIGVIGSAKNKDQGLKIPG